MAKKKQQKEETVKPKISDFIGKKLKDVSRDDGETILEFTNGYKMRLSGYINFGVEVTYNDN